MKPLSCCRKSIDAIGNTYVDRFPAQPIIPRKPCKCVTRRLIKDGLDASWALVQWDPELSIAAFSRDNTRMEVTARIKAGDLLYINEPADVLDVYAESKMARIRLVESDTMKIAAIPDRMKMPTVGPYSGRVIPVEWALLDRLMIRKIEPVLLHAMTEQDAIWEGALKSNPSHNLNYPRTSHLCGYHEWWDELNPGHRWSMGNWWVWAIEFTRTFND